MSYFLSFHLLIKLSRVDHILSRKSVSDKIEFQGPPLLPNLHIRKLPEVIKVFSIPTSMIRAMETYIVYTTSTTQQLLANS